MVICLVFPNARWDQGFTPAKVNSITWSVPLQKCAANPYQCTNTHSPHPLQKPLAGPEINFLAINYTPGLLPWDFPRWNALRKCPPIYLGRVSVKRENQVPVLLVPHLVVSLRPIFWCIFWAILFVFPISYEECYQRPGFAFAPRMAFCVLTIQK